VVGLSGLTRVHGLLPGLAIALLGLIVAVVVSSLVEVLGAIIVAVGLGILVRNLGVLPASADPGLTFAAKKLLRVGIVLLGFRLALTDLLDVGAPALAVVVVIVITTLVATTWLGQRLGLSRELALLTGTGYAICGASAIAAMREVIDADDDAPAFAIALVTIFGTASIVVLPVLARVGGLSTEAFGQWAGSAVHDVGQVVATAAAGGDEALAVAVVVKLTRVLLLGPVLVAVGLWWRRRADTDRTGPRPPLVPLFIVGFVLAAAVRTSGLLPTGAIDLLRTLEGWMLAIALFGLGTGVRIERLRQVGGRALSLGTAAFVVVAGLAYLGVLAVHGTG
jgi:uncharacterized integral membrane protein (TIGR00698 family)